MNPKVSIIIPIYKAEHYIKTCLDSVLSLEMTSWECLLIDDGTPDKSGEICEEYALKDGRFRVFHKENEGVSSARNLGIENANGEWICFVDSDDYLSQDYLNGIDIYEADIVLFNAYKINDNKDLYELNKFDDCILNENEIDEFLTNSLHNILFRVPWGKIIKKTLIKKLRFPLKQKIGEDTVFVLSLLNDIRTLQISKKQIYYWRQSKESDEKKYRTSPMILEEYLLKIYVPYQQLHAKNHLFELFLLEFFFMICDKNSSENVKYWFKMPIVQQIEKDYKDGKGRLPLCYRAYKCSFLIGKISSFSVKLINYIFKRI